MFTSNFQNYECKDKLYREREHLCSLLIFKFKTANANFTMTSSMYSHRSLSNL